MTTASSGGQIISFYSYKGGVGRSMVLANVAWILASNGKKVLTVDWDLEAPGLHHYFYPFLVDRDLVASDGLIDCFTAFAAEAVTPVGKGTVSSAGDWQRSRADLLRYAVSLEWEFPDGGCLVLQW
jgi:AAA domain